MDMPMSFNLLTQNLEQSFRMVYDDYQALFGKKRYARDLLSLLHRWMDWINGQPESEQAQRDGWIRLTAKDLAAMLGFSRRNYETARADLKEMGIVECHRERKVHGKLTWKVNILRLVELIAQMKGRAVIMPSARKDKFPLPDFIPADLWDEYHAVLFKKKGKACSRKDKQAFVEKLTEFHQRGLDIVLIMKKSIDHGWFGFFDPTDSSPHHKMGDDGSAAAKAALAEHNARHQPKPPDKPDRQPEISSAEEKAKGRTNAQQIMDNLKNKKKSW